MMGLVIGSVQTVTLSLIGLLDYLKHTMKKLYNMVIGNCAKHPGHNFINCPLCEIDKINQQLYVEFAEQEKKIDEKNKLLLIENKISKEDFNELLSDCTPYGFYEIVNTPKGTNQYESVGIFKEIYVNQNGGGFSGDDFTGFIYGKLDENKWLMVPYYC